MRTLSREAVLVSTGMTVFSLLMAVIGIGYGGISSTWPRVLLPALLLSVALMLPPVLLLAGAVVTGHGLGIGALQEPLMGPLLISDLLLVACMLRTVAQWGAGKAAAAHRSVSIWLVLFLAWAFLVTVCVGIGVTPLLRIAVYGAVFLLLLRRGTDRRLIYGVLLCYALVNLAGGVLQGQPRLIGLDIGDPAQTGALLLAALCPLLTSELRLPGRWALSAVLLCGIFLTQTRSVWFATVVMVAVWAMKRVSLARVTAVILLLGLLGMQTVDMVTRWFGLNQFSADLRTQSVMQGIRAGMESPVIGHGWGWMSTLSRPLTPASDTLSQTAPYNLFVSVFASVGLPAVVMLTLFLVGLFRHLAAQRGAPLLFTVGVVAMSLTEMTLYAGSMLTLLFFVYAGMGLGPDESRVRDLGWMRIHRKTNQPTEIRTVTHRMHLAKAGGRNAVQVQI
ncbi:hypothetical protein AQJ91_15945 [Streptomyces dysideae]|uniref:O-antigen ligase-related domain-containing protein n=2 Tax=Streptomyces dysideae TaxID=909626 RepID=A0A101V0J9_9ACTN|nr:hypothetical protein AQJ91_15945 [Streptomyces dysideae]